MINWVERLFIFLENLQVQIVLFQVSSYSGTGWN